MVSISCYFFNCAGCVCNISFCSRPPLKKILVIIIMITVEEFYGRCGNDSIYSIRSIAKTDCRSFASFKDIVYILLRRRESKTQIKRNPNLSTFLLFDPSPLFLKYLQNFSLCSMKNHKHNTCGFMDLFLDTISQYRFDPSNTSKKPSSPLVLISLLSKIYHLLHDVVKITLRIRFQSCFHNQFRR
jgi:hypothetical protein